jgi:hypothetical protein
VSVAQCLSLAGPQPTLLRAAREAWPRWCAADPSLAVVDQLVDLPNWTLTAAGTEKAAVVKSLAEVTATEPAAVIALAWLLLPGAARLARQLRDLDVGIDELVAGQLWIEAAGAHRLRGSRIAASILRRTRREVCAELGVGDPGRRRDRAWASAVSLDGLDEAVAAESDPVPADLELKELLADAVKDRAIIGFDVWLLWQLAQVADERAAPAYRGRMGLTTPGIIDVVAIEAGRPAETLRKRAMRALDRLHAYVEVRDDASRFAEWKARHPALTLTAREEMDLAIDDFNQEWRLTGRGPDWVEIAAAAGADRSDESA